MIILKKLQKVPSLWRSLKAQIAELREIAAGNEMEAKLKMMSKLTPSPAGRQHLRAVKGRIDCYGESEESLWGR